MTIGPRDSACPAPEPDMANPLPLPCNGQSVASRTPGSARPGRAGAAVPSGRRGLDLGAVMTPSGRGAAARPPPAEEPLHRLDAGRGAAAPGARPDRRRVRGRRQDPGPRPQPPRAGPVRRDVERALLVQVVPAAPAAPAHRGAAGARRSRRERRGDRRRRRHRGGHPDREPQPPLGHRALPGRRHRRGRHPARHLHHGGAPARRHGPALLRARPTTPASAGSSRAW